MSILSKQQVYVVLVRKWRTLPQTSQRLIENFCHLIEWKSFRRGDLLQGEILDDVEPNNLLLLFRQHLNPRIYA